MSVKGWITAKAHSAARHIVGPLIAPIIEELRGINLYARPSNNPLQARGARYFSQNDEDGILLEIVRRIGLEPATFLELGVGDGTECNTIILLGLGWHGAWIGGEPLAFSLPEHASISFIKQWITRDNVAELARNALGRDLVEAKILSIDLHGNDAEIYRALAQNGLSPEIIVAEYNCKFPPPIRFEKPYSEKHVWSGGDYFGASLQTWCDTLEGYRLVACNETGINAFFVKALHSEKFSDVPPDIGELYRASYFRRSGGAKTSPETVRYLATRPHIN
jgi:hypothetical protein